MSVTIDLRGSVLSLRRGADGSLIVESKESAVTVFLPARIFEKRDLTAMALPERKEYLLGLSLEEPELDDAARVWPTELLRRLLNNVGIETLRDLLRHSAHTLKQRAYRLGDRSIAKIREGLTNINQAFGTDFELLQDEPIGAPPLETEAATLEEFLDSPVAKVIFAPGKDTLNWQIVGAFRKALFQEIAETELNERRPANSPDGTAWEHKARRVIDPLWYKATVRDIIAVDVERIPRRGTGFNTALRRWLASVNARFNSSLEFGQKS